MQDHTHEEPTTATAIGNPKEWANLSSELSKWGDDLTLRLHMDICRFKGKLANQPHVEPDPEYNPKEHLDMWRKKNRIEGVIAVRTSLEVRSESVTWDF